MPCCAAAAIRSVSARMYSAALPRERTAKSEECLAAGSLDICGANSCSRNSRRYDVIVRGDRCDHPTICMACVFFSGGARPQSVVMRSKTRPAPFRFQNTLQSMHPSLSISSNPNIRVSNPPREICCNHVRCFVSSADGAKDLRFYSDSKVPTRIREILPRL